MALTALLDVTVVLVVVTGALLLLLEEVNVSVRMVWPSLCTLLVVVVVEVDPPFVVHLVLVVVSLKCLVVDQTHMNCYVW